MVLGYLLGIWSRQEQFAKLSNANFFLFPRARMLSDDSTMHILEKKKQRKGEKTMSTAQQKEKKKPKDGFL